MMPLVSSRTPTLYFLASRARRCCLRCHWHERIIDSHPEYRTGMQLCWTCRSLRASQNTSVYTESPSSSYTWLLHCVLFALPFRPEAKLPSFQSISNAAHREVYLAAWDASESAALVEAWTKAHGREMYALLFQHDAFESYPRYRHVY